MKIQPTGAAVVAAVVAAACAANTTNGPIGAGGEPTTVTVSASGSSSSTSSGGTGTVTGTSTGVGSCASPGSINDCASCATQNACVMCAAKADQAGVNAYNAFSQCLFCSACYTTCGGSSAGCSGPPVTPGACDKGGTSQSACASCQQCAEGSTCASQLQQCEAVAQCVDLANNLGNVCGSLPM